MSGYIRKPVPASRHVSAVWICAMSAKLSGAVRILWSGHPDGTWVPGIWKPNVSRSGHVWIGGYWGPGGWVVGLWRPSIRVGFHWRVGHWGPRSWLAGSWHRGPHIIAKRRHPRIHAVKHMHKTRIHHHRKIKTPKRYAKSTARKKQGKRQEIVGKCMERRGTNLQKKGKCNQRKANKKKTNGCR